ncbi:hypothetical protein [Paraburkholderia sp.]|uniref:hypothetical protein n=1 Tax=Paraburkholderia sp. TaxID=1926495 RepID=UPI00239D8085|nr:hypothetical protein [Paraburkholderia sp.]MDE1180328.1 hypothetical protein [Paraburkholderia sp.]
MKKRLPSTLAAAALIGLGTCPAAADAQELDAHLDCKSNAHTFISSLLTDAVIEPKPMRVEKNSVNAFRPVRGTKLTAFGFRVYAVVGYEQGDDMFKPGSGEPLSHPVYGVVVSGSMDKVTQRVKSAGIDADTREVTPLLMTAIICSGPSLQPSSQSPSQ